MPHPRDEQLPHSAKSSIEGNHPRYLNRGTETRHRFCDEILESEETLLTAIAVSALRK
jgi:hypothetical protein